MNRLDNINNHSHPRGMGLIVVLVSVAIIGVMAFAFSKWINQFEKEVKNQGPTETNSYLPGIGGESRHGLYTVDGETVEVFAKCGDNVCEPYEGICTPSNQDTATGKDSNDCGVLYCPQDCPNQK
jgi:hypothetical protein